MPIKPENKKLYPKNWKEIRQRILKRARNQCEFCGIEHNAIGYRDEEKEFHRYSLHYDDDFYEDKRMIRIVLTVAHLDHNPMNCDPMNLRALCQQCHNRYDTDHRQENARKTRMKKKSERELFDDI